MPDNQPRGHWEPRINQTIYYPDQGLRSSSRSSSYREQRSERGSMSGWSLVTMFGVGLAFCAIIFAVSSGVGCYGACVQKYDRYARLEEHRIDKTADVSKDSIDKGAEVAIQQSRDSVQIKRADTDAREAEAKAYAAAHSGDNTRDVTMNGQDDAMLTRVGEAQAAGMAAAAAATRPPERTSPLIVISQPAAPPPTVINMPAPQTRVIEPRQQGCPACMRFGPVAGPGVIAQPRVIVQGQRFVQPRQVYGYQQHPQCAQGWRWQPPNNCVREQQQRRQAFRIPAFGRFRGLTF